MAKKKKRRAPRKRAETEAQVRDFIKRTEKLLEQWIGRTCQAAIRVKRLQKKLAYYQQRADELQAAKLRTAEERAAETREQARRRVEREAGKSLRGIDLT